MKESVDEQLLHAFQAVFPAHSDEQLRQGTPDTLTTWDSSNHMILIMVIEEAFGIRIPEREAGELLSFSEFRGYLSSRTT
jgi:acyl carrier protein